MAAPSTDHVSDIRGYSHEERSHGHHALVADLRRQPDAIFIVDLRKEQLAVREARRLGMPILALVDAVFADGVDQPAVVGSLQLERLAGEGIDRRPLRQCKLAESFSLPAMLGGELSKSVVNPQ